MAVMLRTALLFGLFQALMPLLGWLVTSTVASSLEAYGHWLAFLMLLYIGGRMVWQSLRGDSGDQSSVLRPERLTVQLLLAVATSIDALAVGFSMAVTGYTAPSQLTLPLVVIGMASLLLSLVGHWLGVRFGRAIARRIRPELLGGIILVVLGLKVLLVQ